mmetsp:Transcript_18114/g.31760  ORF Transcript_18114/g.31760 Transcript_18114/m.31760 type:complete len:110 (+) Transcript_18114:894-1223(+)
MLAKEALQALALLHVLTGSPLHGVLLMDQFRPPNLLRVLATQALVTVTAPENMDTDGLQGMPGGSWIAVETPAIWLVISMHQKVHQEVCALQGKKQRPRAKQMQLVLQT